MLPVQIVCAECGTPRVGRKKAPDSEFIPYRKTCSDCGSEDFDIREQATMSEQATHHSTDFRAVLRAQKQRVKAALKAEKSVDATPILRDDETLACEEYVTLVYELHHVHLPELQADGVVEFNRREETITRGPRFDEK